MKHTVLILLLALSNFASPARADVQLSFDFFYDSLAPYGEWMRAGDYGDVWQPADVDDDWTPYSDGYWAYTDAGWTWVSYEDWGGITYHYGRWTRLNHYGWCWVPGYEWGPAWVSWRRSDDYVGWAPLPPEARWSRDTGFGVWVDTAFDIGPGYFRFCHTRDFGAPFLRPVLLPRAQNITIIQQTTNITNITFRRDHGHAFNCGPDFAWVSPRSARQIPALKLIRNPNDVFAAGGRGRVVRNSPSGNTLVVGAPVVRPDAPAANGGRRPIVRSLTNPQVDRGWAGMADNQTRDRIREKLAGQTAGASPKNAPARAFDPELVAAVPKRAEPRGQLPIAGPPRQPDPIPQPLRPEIARQKEAPPIATPTVPVARPGRSKEAILPAVPPPTAEPRAVAAEPREAVTAGELPEAGLRAKPLLPAADTRRTVPEIAKVPGVDSAVETNRPPQIPRSAPAPIVESPKLSRKVAAPVARPEPQTPSPQILPQPGRSIRENRPPIAVDHSDAVSGRRNVDAAAAMQQQRAAEENRQRQMAAEQRRNRDAAAAESARRQVEAQRAASDQARVAAAQRAAEAQRQQNELGARRAAEEGRQRQMEMLRQQQAAAAEAARRQAVPAKVPAPRPAPVATPPQFGRPAPATGQSGPLPGDPLRRRGRGGERGL